MDAVRVQIKMSATKNLQCSTTTENKIARVLIKVKAGVILRGVYIPSLVKASEGRKETGLHC